jgi:hypothetical protein
MARQPKQPPKKVTVQLRRANGRLVKEYTVNAGYPLRKLRKSLDDKYDTSYIIEEISG